MRHQKSAPERLPDRRGQKRKAVLLASLLLEESRQVKAARALRNDLASLAFEFKKSGRGFCRGLSLALDHAQLELEAAVDASALVAGREVNA